jgi:pimeloyl-ACP methyl ester carboxylesterase
MKLIITLTVMLLLNLCAFAQTDLVRNELNSIFQNIDKTQIPTGYLNEYGPEVVYKKWLNGVLSDSNLIADMNIYNFLYNDIENCRINIPSNTPPIYARITQPIVPPLDSVKQWIDVSRYDTVTNLAIFSANYASLREDALQQNLFTKVGNQIFDVAGRTQSPYILNHTFAAAPVLQESKFTNQIRLGYTSLFYGNNSYGVSTVQVNFLDGAGYQNIYSNGAASSITKTYTDSSGFKKFAVKVIYTNGSIDECYTGQMVNVILSAANNTASRYEALATQEILNPIYSVFPSSYSNINPTIPQILLNIPNATITQDLLRLQKFNQNMKVYVRYSKKRPLGTYGHNKIIKPFIVVEGYDITDASQLLKANNYSINTLIDEWDKTVKTPTTFDFNKELDEQAGYDLIFIDYYTMRNITENADYLLQAIDWINSQKENNAVGVREQNIVMGISMGGLVSRYALAKRTKLTNTNTTETKELITMDSPHQGANVPLGLQHFLYDFGETKIIKKIGDISDELKAFYYLNSLPATQQQLILRVTDGNGGRVNNTFLADGGAYRTMVDYTAPYPFYAISNGSQCAVSVMQPSTLFLSKDGEVATANWNLFFYKNKYKLNIQVNSLPVYGNQSQICSVVMERNIRLFWGLIGTGWKTTSNTAPRISPANTIPWDGVSGGTKSTETAGPISQTGTNPDINIKDHTFLLNVWRSLKYIYLVNVHSDIQLPFSQKEFSFVPITSALDVQNVTANTFNRPFNFAVNGLTGSRANKFIAQDFAASNLFNIEHTNFTPRNSRWLYNEMENITQPSLNCDDACGNIATINGPDAICTTANYTLSNYPANTLVTWSSSNPLVATVSGTGMSAVVTRISDAPFLLTATANCSGSNPVTKQIRSGGYHPSDYQISGANAYGGNVLEFCANQSYGFGLNGHPASNIQWSWPANWTQITGQGSVYIV